MGGQVVDTATAEEFMQQVLQQVSSDEMGVIARVADRKRARLSELMNGGTPDPAGMREAMKLMFGLRRKADVLMSAAGEDALCAATGALLAAGPVADRVNEFTAVLAGHEDLATELASELLHFTAPADYWLWTRWMWDPRTETGALRLVTMDEFSMTGNTPGETYLRVGEAVAFVTETGRAVGFAGSSPYGLDVFLACVYGIYMYTVLRMRMTQEFNQVVPQLPELARRLLGVHRLEA